jgi:hypothetical protein
MHASQCPAARPQQGVRRHASRANAPAMFNLLTGPQLLEGETGADQGYSWQGGDRGKPWSGPYCTMSPNAPSDM